MTDEQNLSPGYQKILHYLVAKRAAEAAEKARLAEVEKQLRREPVRNWEAPKRRDRRKKWKKGVTQVRVVQKGAPVAAPPGDVLVMGQCAVCRAPLDPERARRFPHARTCGGPCQQRYRTALNRRSSWRQSQRRYERRQSTREERARRQRRLMAGRFGCQPPRQSPLGVEGNGYAMVLDQAHHQQEVVAGVLLLAEQGIDHDARGVVDGPAAARRENHRLQPTGGGCRPPVSASPLGASSAGEHGAWVNGGGEGSSDRHPSACASAWSDRSLCPRAL